MRISLMLAAALVLTACAKDVVRPDAPRPAAEILPVYVPTYVPIDKELRGRCEWKRSCRPSEGIDCAKQRADCLVQYEQQLDGIDQVQGKPVPNAKGAK